MEEIDAGETTQEEDVDDLVEEVVGERWGWRWGSAEVEVEVEYVTEDRGILRWKAAERELSEG